jgi:ATP:ADP antiporter, AAA family
MARIGSGHWIAPRRIALAPAAILFAILTAHAVLETARDALFLARLGPERLAWAYLAIAGGALLALTALRRWGKLRDPRRLLVGLLVLAAVGTSAIAATITFAPGVVFLLYVWTGVVATLVVPSFWTLVDRSARISEAKRVFAVIAAGGTLGAMCGSAIGALLGRIVPAHHLVTVGAVGFLLATIAAVALAPQAAAERASHAPVRSLDPVTQRSRRYVRWILILGVVSTIAVTLGDLLFKRVLAERIAPEDLAWTFGAIYTGLNIVALVVQLALTPHVLTRLGVGGALVVLPTLLVVSAAGFAITGAMIAAIALKLGDGGLRHSLHRVASEILYLPVPSLVRDRAKPIADAIGHRGGQALAALLVFALAAAGAGATGMAGVTALLGIVWLVAIVVVRRRYVAQFRDTLEHGDIHRDVRLPELDATSIDLLVAALSSPDELEALAALDVLERRAGRIPALVLYHPSPAVVRRALGLLAGDPRPEVRRVVARLFAHPDPEIRAAALVASGADSQVTTALDDPAAVVRATALVVLARDPEHAEGAVRRLEALCRGTTADRLAVARALALALDPGACPPLRDVIAELLARREPAVRREVLRMLARFPELVVPGETAVVDLERITALLQDPHTRGDVRRVLCATNHDGLAYLISALEDPRTPLAVRRHIPRTISKFPRSREAIAALVARLPREPDRTTEFKILRALGRLRDDQPRVAIDRATIRGYVRRTLADAARYTTLGESFASWGPRRASTELIAELLADKRRYTIEHAFRALAILWPRSGLRSVHDAITSPDEERRAAAREVIEHLLPGDLRQPLLAVLDDLPPHVRRGRLGSLAVGPFSSYEGLLAVLLEDRSESLRCVVAYHVEELRRSRPVSPRPTNVSPVIARRHG